jgi:release factor glutamine methyltransferase
MAVKLQTIKDIRNYLASELEGLYTRDETRSIADIILPYVYGVSKIKILSEYNAPVSKETEERIAAICRELKTGKPVQYITGESLFYHCIIKVNPGVLIPRPETEELVDHVVRENKGFHGNIVEVGTGSGCIAIAVALNLPGANVTAVDISQEALQTAAENARLNNATVSFRQYDILDGKPAFPVKADLIISNPPYIRVSEKLQMNRNVLDFEPHNALFVPDSDPLVFYRAIFNMAVYSLSPGGSVYFEINEAMGEQIRQMAESYGYIDISVISDINRKDRIMKGRKNV